MNKSIIKYIEDDFVTDVDEHSYYVILKWCNVPTLLSRRTINGFYKYAKQ